MGKPIYENPYHVKVVQFGVTRNLNARFPDIRDEIITAFDDLLSEVKADGEYILCRSIHSQPYYVL